MTYAIMIPARYASTRFPGKPLAMLGDKPVIQHVCENASRTGLPTYVATDDPRIARCVESFGGKAILTPSDCPSGTDRLAKAVETLANGNEAAHPDVVINVQGDEPFVRPEQIEALKNCFERYPATQIATLAQRFDPSQYGENPFNALADPNLVKVVFDNAGRALYFSRSVIPYVRGVEKENWLYTAEFHTHVGMYAYRTATLMEVARLPRSPLEIAESLEQLRWLQNGYDIRVALTRTSNIGIDTPADLERASRLLP